MKQPALGRKISDLRKAKGLTQEELVEKCNISVRTIQRIETGEVMPRNFTIRTIFQALDHDVEGIFEEERQPENISDGAIKNADREVAEQGLANKLNVAFIAGIVSFLLSFPNGMAEYFGALGGELFDKPLLLSLKIILLLSTIYFSRGFTFVGRHYKNNLLIVSSFILIGANVLLAAFECLLMYDTLDSEVAIVGMSLASVMFGAVGLVYGFSLRRLHHALGSVAELSGVLEMASALLFLSVIFSWFGEFVQIPAAIFQICLLYKAKQQLGEGQQKNLEVVAP